jgi:hypothetical protein
MERDGIHPYNEWNKWWKARPKLSNVTVAERGGLLGPSNRITHLITSRGDERLTRVLFYLATTGRKIVKDTSEAAGKAVEKLIKMSGIEPESIWGEVPESSQLPHHQFTIQPIP